MMENNNRTKKSYFSNGLNISSFIPLEEFVSTNTSPNIVIKNGNVRETFFYKNFKPENIIRRPELGLEIRATKEVFSIDWYQVGACLIQNGSSVTIEINNNIAEIDIKPLITGPILAIILHQLKLHVLHASAVNINGKAIVFLGNKGFGKSTIAAHLQSKGYKLISDDLVPITFNNKVAETIPGHPQIRLFPDSVESIGLNPDGLPLVNSWMDKRYIDTPNIFSTKPIKIGCIFVLNVSDNIEIKEMNPATAFVEVARNNYMKSYINVTENTKEHFEGCQKLIKSVPVFQLNRPHDFKYMSQVIDLIENHLMQKSTNL